MRTIPTIIHKPSGRICALSRLSVGHQVSMTAPALLNIQTNMNETLLCEPTEEAETEPPRQDTGHLDDSNMVKDI